MIKDPRQYTREYPKSNVLIKQALDILNKESDFDALVILISNILKNENDALINVALNLSPSFEVSNIIWKALNTAINEDIPVYMFAIPLVLVAGSKTKSTLGGNLDTSKLNEYFTQNKIFAKGVDSFISGKLIDPGALAKIKPSQLYYWGRNLKNANLWLPIKLEGIPVPVFNEGVFLRFLIGLSINSNNMGINQEAYRNASIGLMKLIGDELGNESITLFSIPFPPVYLSGAYPVGDSKRMEIAITVAISNIVRKIREQGQIPIAVIGSENEALKISIISQNDPTLKETSLWHLTKFENFEEYVEILTNLLQDMQVEYSYVS